ncbi:hypothetical protein GF362_03280 [Candidatus Dojkabacteria bacterium]|nr:hypothetical protein [Candidatus Dojkabacteria bacterium]
MKTFSYDPVCGKKMNDKESYVDTTRRIHENIYKFSLCCPECHNKFEQDSMHYFYQALKLEKKAKDMQI